GLREALDYNSDHLDLWIVDEVTDVVLDRGDRRVAAGNHVGESQLAVVHKGRECVVAKSSALRDDCHWSSAQRKGDCAAVHSRPSLYIQQTEAIRTANTHAAGGEPA